MCAGRAASHGCAEAESLSKSAPENSRNFDSRWKASIIRTVPDFARITIDWVWAPPPVLKRIGLLFLIVLVYALLFDKLGFMIATALMTVPVARFFGGTWKQGIVGGIGLGVGMFFFFDRLLDVALPTGL